MDQFAGLIEAIAALAWPLLAILVVLRFSPGVRELLRSARTRRFTIKLGGQELTMDEISAQQNILIGDLQAQVVDLRDALDAGSQPAVVGTPAVDAVKQTGPARILWVDDRPKNNSWLVEQLTSSGIQVDLALSTSEGLSCHDRQDYRAIVSDLGRHEDGEFQRDAGLRFLASVRETDGETPVAFFTNERGVRAHARDAERLGASLITSSATELVNLLKKRLPEWRGTGSG